MHGMPEAGPADQVLKRAVAQQLAHLGGERFRRGVKHFGVLEFVDHRPDRRGDGHGGPLSSAVLWKYPFPPKLTRFDGVDYVEIRCAGKSGRRIAPPTRRLDSEYLVRQPFPSSGSACAVCARVVGGDVAQVV